MGTGNILGYKISFDDPPIQKTLPHKIRFSDSVEIVIDREVNNMLQEGVIIKSTHEPDEFISIYLPRDKT